MPAINKQNKETILMANYIETYEKTIEAIMRQYNDKTNDGKLEREASYKLHNTDYYDQPEATKQRIMADTKTSILNEYKADARLDIEDAQRKLKKDHEAELNRIERLRLKAAIGASQVTAYARANAMTEDDARAELEQYAKVKTSQFSDSVIDRYAALRNRSRLEGNDQSKAYQFYNEEVEKLGINAAVKATERAKYYFSQPPQQALDMWNSSGAVIARQLERQNKEAQGQG